MKHAIPTLGLLALVCCTQGETVVLEDATASAIPDNNTPVVRTLAFAQQQRVVAGVTLDLDLLHPWVGDLVVTVEAPDGTELRVIDRPGLVPSGFPGPWGCGGDDIDAAFDDGATRDATDACSITGTPVYAGTIRPADPFAGFVGLNPAGDWIVRVRDAQAGDAGTLRSVRLTIDVEEDCDLDGVPDECSVCLGDIDGDGEVDLGDFGSFGSAFGSVIGDDAYDSRVDFDGDGDVDLGDFGLFGGEFGRGDCS